MRLRLVLVIAAIGAIFALSACSLGIGTVTKQVTVGGHTYNCVYRKTFNTYWFDSSRGYFTYTLISGGALC